MHPKVHSPTRADRLRELGRVFGVAVAGILATVAVIGPVMWYFALSGKQRRELVPAPEQRGEAVVTSVTYPQATEGVPVKEPIYRVEFRGRAYEVQGQTEARPGDRVTVTYRVAPNGDVYVESIGAAARTR